MCEGEIVRDDLLPLLNLGKWLLWSQCVVRRLSSAVVCLERIVYKPHLSISTKCGYIGGLAVEDEFVMHW